MGGLDTYLFDPPREPFNVHLSESNMQWRRRFSADHARAFNRHGWSYYTKEWHEEWYPGYTNAWASLLGAVGLLYEQAGVNAASIKQATGQELTYREAVEHHIVSSLANLHTMRANRRQILADFAADRRWAVSNDGPFTETLLLPPPADRAKFNRFVDLLRRQGIETGVAGAEFQADGVVDVWGAFSETRTFPEGTLLVRSAQPHRRLLHAILEFDPHMSEESLREERKELENYRGTRIYDTTAWNLPMAYGLDAVWADTVPEVPLRSAQMHAGTAVEPGTEPQYGYLIDGSDGDVFVALVRLFERDCRPRVAQKPFTIGGREYHPGAVLLRRHENPVALSRIVQEVTTDLVLDVRPTDTALSEKGSDLGGNRFRLLHPPRVAIASQWPFSTGSFGSTWYLLDQRLGLRASPVNGQRLARMDLRKYNVLVLPHTWRAESLGAVLDTATTARLKAWVEAGGTLIALGDTAAFLASKDRGLSGVRLRRDVLEELSAYEEARQRERKARTIEIDPDEVWGNKAPSEPTTAPAATTAAGAEPTRRAEALERADQWLRLFSPRGAIAAAELDPEHWLSFGVGVRLPVLLVGSYAYMSRHPIATPARLSDDQNIRLSGLFWPEARQRWAGSAYATVERVGAGQIILFASDPFFRGYFEGSGRLLLNAIVLGPGMGTSQPHPW
jgi:hypothetical protein